MCRNIHVLFNLEPPATDLEIRAAAEQYVRKVSGRAKPSRVNEDAYWYAVEQISAATRELVDTLQTSAAPLDREVEAAKARERAKKRFG